jgi:putative transposase
MRRGFDFRETLEKRRETEPCQNVLPIWSEVEREKGELERLTKRHRSKQQQAQRARIVLAAAQGHSNAQIARELQVNVDTVRLWRDRWGGRQDIDLEMLPVAERLQDAPRPGAPPKFAEEQRCQMAAFACEAPMKAGRPISQWTGREIADELKKRGIVEQISSRHASHLVKKGGCNRIVFGIG